MVLLKYAWLHIVCHFLILKCHFYMKNIIKFLSFFQFLKKLKKSVSFFKEYPGK